MTKKEAKIKINLLLRQYDYPIEFRNTIQNIIDSIETEKIQAIQQQSSLQK